MYIFVFLRCVYGAQVFDFHPTAYILPNEYLKFVSDYTKESQKHGKKVKALGVLLQKLRLICNGRVAL